MLDFPRLLTFLESLFILLKSLDFIYLFQIKEYRFDRFASLIREEGIINIFFVRGMRMPAKKTRNYLLVIFAAIVSSLFFIYFQNLDIIYLVILIIFLPFIAFTNIFLGVLLTGILATAYRNRIIKKAAKMVENSKAVFIGITGSYGKTTTKELLYQILSHKYSVSKTSNNMNSDIGVAISIVNNLKEDTDIFIAEIGAYRKGEISEVAKFVKPKYGILTGIGNQHLDLFGSKDNLIAAKKELLQSIPSDGKAYINKDIKALEEITKDLKYPICLYSIHHEADIAAHNLEVHNHFTKADIEYKGNYFTIKLPLIGRHNLANILPCLALALDLGFTKEEVTKAVSKIHPISSKLSVKKGPNNSTIIFDSNNSNFEGFIASIETAAEFPQIKKIILSKGIIELGSEKIDSYKKIVNEIDKKNLRLWTTDKLFKSMDKTNKVHYFRRENELITDLLRNLDEYTLLIVEGKFTTQFIKELTDGGTI